MQPKKPATTQMFPIKSSHLADIGEEAAARNIPLEDLIAERLEKGANTPSAVFISNKQHILLQRLSGEPLATGQEVVDYWNKAFTIKVDDVTYTLDPLVRERLLTRCFDRPLKLVLKEALDEFFVNYVQL